MSKAVKALITDELKNRYGSQSSACVLEMTGMDIAAQEKLRKILRSRSARVEVIRNRLARVAFAGTALQPLGDALRGPNGLVTSSQSLIEVARLLVEAAKEFTTLKLKQAIFDGDPRLMTIVELSKLKGKPELLGELAALISSPGMALAGCIGGPQARLAGCVKTLADKAA